MVLVPRVAAPRPPRREDVPHADRLPIRRRPRHAHDMDYDVAAHRALRTAGAEELVRALHAHPRVTAFQQDRVWLVVGAYEAEVCIDRRTDRVKSERLE